MNPGASESETNGVFSGSVVDITPLLASLNTDARQAAENVLARALIFAEDADEALRNAVSIRTEAERYRSEVETETVLATEQLCAQLKAEAQREVDEAGRLRADAEAYFADAQRTLTAAEKEKAEAEEFRKRVEADAGEEAKTLISQARSEADRETSDMRDRAVEEIAKAVSGIQKMKDAVQAELEAQTMYTEALRIKAMAPSRDEVVGGAVSKTPGKARARSSRQRAAA